MIVVHLVAVVHVSSYIRVHRPAFLLGTGLWVRAPHSSNVAQLTREVCHALRCFRTKLSPRAMPLEMLALEGVAEGGVSVPAQDQLFVRGVTEQPGTAMTVGTVTVNRQIKDPFIVFRFLPSCLANRHAMKLGKQTAIPAVAQL
jgi:hypothetical protein